MKLGAVIKQTTTETRTEREKKKIFYFSYRFRFFINCIFLQSSNIIKGKGKNGTNIYYKIHLGCYQILWKIRPPPSPSEFTFIEFCPELCAKKVRFEKILSNCAKTMKMGMFCKFCIQSLKLCADSRKLCADMHPCVHAF